MMHPALQSLGNADVTTGVVLLTGVDRLSLDAATFSLMDSCPSACSIVYHVCANDNAEYGLDIVRRVNLPLSDELSHCVNDALARAETMQVSDCCLSCTVKHDAGRMLETLRGVADVFLVVLPVGLEAIPVMQYLDDMFQLDAWGESMEVSAIGNVVGLDAFEERFFDDDRLLLCGVNDDDVVFDERSTGVVVSRLIREASHVLELPVVGSGCLSRHVDEDEACDCRGIIRSIAANDAVVCPDVHDLVLMDLVRPAVVNATKR